ncbi:MAG: hypothetical protein ACRBB5_00170 [Nitrosopumilus sp.]
MFFVTGAVGFVTAGFFENLFDVDFLGEWTLLFYLPYVFQYWRLENTIFLIV